MAKTLFTGKFHGNIHETSGRATVYQEAHGKLVLRLTAFKTSNGPDVHVILVATKDASDDANFLNSNTERVELGKLKGNGEESGRRVCPTAVGTWLRNSEKKAESTRAGAWFSSVDAGGAKRAEAQKKKSRVVLSVSETVASIPPLRARNTLRPRWG